MPTIRKYCTILFRHQTRLPPYPELIQASNKITTIFRVYSNIKQDYHHIQSLFRHQTKLPPYSELIQTSNKINKIFQWVKLVQLQNVWLGIFNYIRSRQELDTYTIEWLYPVYCLGLSMIKVLFPQYTCSRLLASHATGFMIHQIGWLYVTSV